MEKKLLNEVQGLIKNLRNNVDVESNLCKFKGVVDENSDEILKTFNLRWLISICDTYADYGNPIEQRNSLLISLFVNLIRVSDTYTLTMNAGHSIEMIEKLKVQQIPLVGGLVTLNIDKQDTCLNLSKRMNKLLPCTPFLFEVYRKASRELLMSDSLLKRFSNLSDRPGFVFPENALEIPDNYGVV